MKNVIITILAILVLGMGGYLVYDKVNTKDDNEIKVESTNNNKTENTDVVKTNDFDSKYVGTYKGEKGNDLIIISEDGTYKFVKSYTDAKGNVETKESNGLVISNGVYIALVEFYDTYPTEIAPLLNSYHFYVKDLN